MSDVRTPIIKTGDSAEGQDTMTLDDIKGRCVIDEITDCWIFKGAISDKRYTRVWAPNHNKPGSPMQSIPGKRAVWYVTTGQAIPQGHRVFSKKCTRPDCLNPDHIACGPAAEWGKQLTRSGIYKGKASRSVASRKTGAARSGLTQETFHEVIASNNTGREEARRLGVSEQTISRARNGHLKSFVPIASPFAGLGARA